MRYICYHGNMNSLSNLADDLENDLENTHFDYDPFEEQTEEPCPDCGAREIVKTARQDSPDDFTWEYVCRACGSTWEG